MKHPYHYTRLAMSGDTSNNMGPESHLSDEQLAELDDKELFAVLGVKNIMGRAYKKIILEECAGAQDYMNDN